jgi:hypothetical protein
MFTALGIYAESFEKPFITCTSEFYAAEGTRYMQQTDVPDYLIHVEVRVLIHFCIQRLSKRLLIFIMNFICAG